jgi:hypothetical protein
LRVVAPPRSIRGDVYVARRCNSIQMQARLEAGICGRRGVGIADEVLLLSGRGWVKKRARCTSPLVSVDCVYYRLGGAYLNKPRPAIPRQGGSAQGTSCHLVWEQRILHTMACRRMYVTCWDARESACHDGEIGMRHAVQNIRPFLKKTGAVLFLCGRGRVKKRARSSCPAKRGNSPLYIVAPPRSIRGDVVMPRVAGYVARRCNSI